MRKSFLDKLKEIKEFKAFRVSPICVIVELRKMGIDPDTARIRDIRKAVWKCIEERKFAGHEKMNLELEFSNE